MFDIDEPPAKDDQGPKSVGEAWKMFLAMLRRDFPWVVCCLILLILLMLSVMQGVDEENACNKRYEPFVRTCYESHGLLPTGEGFNYTWNLSIDDRMSGDRWQQSPGGRFE